MVVMPNWCCSVAQPDTHLSVQRTQRFVEQQQPRLGRQRAGQGDALLLSTGQLRRVFVFLVHQPDRFQKLSHPGVDLRLRRLAANQPVGDVLVDRQVGKQRVGLEDDAEIPFQGRQSGNIPTGLFDAAMGLDVEARDGAQQSRLAAARWPQKTDEFAFKYLERDVFQRREIAEHLGQVLNFEINVLAGHLFPLNF